MTKTSSISNNSVYQTIQFSISMPLILFNPIDRAQLGATTPGQSGPESNGNEEVLHISQGPSITGTSPSDCFVSYPGHTLGCFTSLQRCSQCILQPQSTGQLKENKILILGLYLCYLLSFRFFCFFFG